MRNSPFLFFILLSFVFISCQKSQDTHKVIKKEPAPYSDLENLFKEWRAFENPPKLNGAPDYRKATFEKRMPDFQTLQAKLLGMDTSGWSIAEQVDWRIVWAEMNGFDFNYRILKPWERDPAFYKSIWMERSDVPDHEGPTHHGIVEVWQYDFPLEESKVSEFLGKIEAISALNTQAKENLTGNAKELWEAGIPTIEQQVSDLQEILGFPGVAENQDLAKAIQEAIGSTEDLVKWLKEEASKKDGPSGLGKENYTWYLQNVHLVPLTWEDEVMILKRELARAWSSLKLEEHQNRNLPPLEAADTPEEFEKLTEKSIQKMMDFLEKQEILTVKDYFEPALREHRGTFVPKEKRNFFTIGMHYDPLPLYSHFYHWFELAIMDNEPHKSLIRSGPLLYNIFDSRNEGTATAVEEMFMDAGLYSDSPRSREIVYIMVAQRAARGLGSLYAQANEMTMVEAGGIHSNYTPRGWMKTEKELLLFEQHLYMRQPGYGSSYITGKYLLENALADFARIQEEKGEVFTLRHFFDQLNAIGSIPIALGHWEMTGVDPFMKKFEE
ncbi:hypothetical protein DFQ04_2066 [Algoriphagus boseongensis]|uniref:DUF885 family protein n=1 Tax=Algoriphagus boseongensis TaxID=1442587 RepID=A0A4R6T512_9BACT|nr:hypothetical protein [Algoriphagus boseongensis]TDQ17413.1 hypothetical protein DFQ04_2066 [Algoriphagus boseongensis]